MRKLWKLEAQHWKVGLKCVAGIDEAGRGAWAGPVVVAAVMLPPDAQPRPYRDSKTLSATAREQLALQIKAEALAWATEFAPAAEVDGFGVLAATKRAALRAIAKLQPSPNALVTDYLKLATELPTFAPARADSQSYSVAAASILAKTARDAQMLLLDAVHPGYGFAKHKGYGTKTHQLALQKLGVSVEHRRSFKPIKLIIEK